jgi:hypothetical protein
LIVFREVLEAGLIVGVVMAVTSGLAGRGPWVAGGLAAGVLGACVVAPLKALLAAGMAAQAITFLEQANFLTAFDETVRDMCWS